MISIILISSVFFLLVIAVFLVSIRKKAYTEDLQDLFPKSRTEMIKGIALIGIVLSHLASYSKGMAPSGILKYYNLFCTTLGGVGVNLFFFISGYGNQISIMRSEKRISWLLKRVINILIIFLFCYILTVGILYCTGYQGTISTLFDKLIHLEIPYSSVWYVKIQLLVYLFLFISSYISNKKVQTLCLAILCVILSIVLYKLGYEDKWWKSTFCFAIGAVSAAYRTEIISVVNKKKGILTLLGIALLPISFIGGVLIENFISMIVGNALLCIVMMYFFTVLKTENKAFMKLGAYSLQAYLVHRSIVAWILRDGQTTNLKVMLIVGLSVIGTIIAKWTSEKVVKLCFDGKKNAR